MQAAGYDYFSHPLAYSCCFTLTPTRYGSSKNLKYSNVVWSVVASQCLCWVCHMWDSLLYSRHLGCRQYLMSDMLLQKCGACHWSHIVGLIVSIVEPCLYVWLAFVRGFLQLLANWYVMTCVIETSACKQWSRTVPVCAAEFCQACHHMSLIICWLSSLYRQVDVTMFVNVLATCSKHNSLNVRGAKRICAIRPWAAAKM